MAIRELLCRQPPWRRCAVQPRGARRLSSLQNAVRGNGLRVGVLGLGAIGTIFFTKLSQIASQRGSSIRSVDAIVKSRHLERLKQHPRLLIRGVGVQGNAAEEAEVHVDLDIEGIDTSVTDDSVRIAALSADNDANREPLDLILVALKAYDSAPAVEQLQRQHKHLFKDDTAFVLLQNGLSPLPSSNGLYEYVHGVTYVGGRIIAPNTVAVTGLTAGATYLAPAERPATPERGRALASKLQSFSDALNQAGINTQLLSQSEMQTVQWRKLVVNASINPVAAILDSSNGNTRACKWSRRCVESAVKEAMAIARLEGVDLQCTEEEMIATVLNVASSTSTNVCSTVADLRRGARTEVDSINGAILACADRHGVPAPINTLLYNAVKALETQKLRQR